MTEQMAAPPALACPHCGAGVSPDQAFCENCGNPLQPTVAATADSAEDLESPVELTVSARRPPPPEDEATIPVTKPCQNCGGVVGADGSLTGYAGGLARKRALLELEEPAERAAERLF